MTTHAEAIFETGDWDEEPFAAVEGAMKLTRALVTGSYSGDIQGQTTIAFIMQYADDSNANYSGLERIAGQLAGRNGTFVLRHEGTFTEGEARTTLSVVPDSGTGALAGLRGEGRSVAPIGSRATVTLDYAFE